MAGRTLLIATMLALLLFESTAFAVGTGVDIQKQLGCEPRFFSLNVSGGYAEARAELFNPGTVGYKARARLDVMSDGGIIFSGWSKEEVLMPGQRVPYRLSWFSEEDRSVTARLRFSCATETAETENLTWQIIPQTAESIFRVSDIRTYGSEMVFDLTSDKDVSEAAVFVSDCMPGWIFEEVKVSGMKAGKPVSVHAPYHTGVFTNNTISINAVGNGGRYYTKTSYCMTEESGVMMYWNMLLDFLKSITRF